MEITDDRDDADADLSLPSCAVKGLVQPLVGVRLVISTDKAIGCACFGVEVLHEQVTPKEARGSCEEKPPTPRRGGAHAMLVL